MVNSKMRFLTVVCSVAVVVLAMPAISNAGWFGCQSCAAPVVAAPACATCVAPTVTYMPTPVYRALYRPAVAAYQPAVSYSAYTAYRPVFGGWGYSARLVPYTTYYAPSYAYTAYYQPAYYAAMPQAACSSCNSCAGYSPCSTCSPCSGGVSYEVPTSGCATCPAQATVVTPAPVGSNQSPPRTFQEEKSQKPATETELKPIPQADTRLNSMPLPALPDPKDRTASRSDYSSPQVRFVASPVQTSPMANDDGWRPARN